MNRRDPVSYKISVITPSYNQGKFIESTIKSVMDQNYDSIEHIVVDGGSDDNTVEVLKRYPHLKWVSEPDEGQTDAGNKGLRMATGDLIGWINSDDLYFPNIFSKISEIFEKNPDIYIIYGDCNWIDGDGRFIKKIKELPFSLHRLLFYNYIVHPTIFVRKEVFEEIGYYRKDFEYSMDYEFLIRAARKYKIVHFPLFIAKMRLHPDCKTHLFRARQMSDNERLPGEYPDVFDKVKRSKLSYGFFKIWYRLSVHFVEFYSNPFFCLKKYSCKFLSVITFRKFKPDYRLGLSIPE